MIRASRVRLHDLRWGALLVAASAVIWISFSSIGHLQLPAPPTAPQLAEAPGLHLSLPERAASLLDRARDEAAVSSAAARDELPRPRAKPERGARAARSTATRPPAGLRAGPSTRQAQPGPGTAPPSGGGGGTTPGGGGLPGGNTTPGGGALPATGSPLIDTTVQGTADAAGSLAGSAAATINGTTMSTAATVDEAAGDVGRLAAAATTQAGSLLG